MRKLSSPMRYQVFARLEATSLYGLLDHLRYDRACPFTEYDANLIEQAMMQPGSFDRIIVVLTRWVENKNLSGGWTQDRWSSGGSFMLTPITSEEAMHVKRILRPMHKEICRGCGSGVDGGGSSIPVLSCASCVEG